LISKEIHECYIEEHPEHSFPVKTELVFERMLPSNQKYQGRQGLIFFQMGLFSSVEEIHISLQRTPFDIEAGSSSTLFPFENCVKL
jgi:hypothetical protein